MPDTLEQLLSQVGAFKKGSDEATQQVIGALSTQVKLTTSIADQYTQQGVDDTTVQTAKNAADYATQLSRVRAANMAGVNLKNNNEVLSSLSSAAADAQARKDEALAAIADKDKVGFMDNPIEYLYNQFTINSDIAKHNIANAQLESAQNRIMAVNAAAQTTIQTQNAISEPLTAASMEASARTAAVAANVAAAQAQIAAINYGTKGIEFALNAKKDVLALGFQAQSAKTAEINTGIALQNLELHKKTFEQQQEAYTQGKLEKADQLVMGQSVIDTINVGRKALLGAAATPLDDISGKMAIAALKGKGTLSVELQKYFDAGERTKLAGTPIIGTTPAAAASTLQAVPVQLNPTQLPIKTLLGQAAQDTTTAMKNVASGVQVGKNANPVFQGMDPKDKSTIDAAYNGRAQQLLNGYGSVIKSGDGDNPYQIASINQLVSNSPTVAALPVVQKVFAPLIKAGVQLNDPKQIVSLVGEAVAKGTISHQEAVELTTLYHVGVTANLAMRNFPGFGLIPSRSYNASIETNPNAWTPNEVVDLTKPDQVSRALMKLQAARLQEQYSNGSRNIFTGKTGNFNAPDDGTTMFKPQPQQAQAVQQAVDNAGKSVDTFFNNLPNQNNTRRDNSAQNPPAGKIKYNN